MVVVDGLKIRTKEVLLTSMMRTEIWSVIGTNQNGVRPTRVVWSVLLGYKELAENALNG